jgi:exonuclease III
MKLRFYHLLEVRTRAILDSGSFVIIVGDINTCHKPIDHCDPSDMVSLSFLNLVSDKCQSYSWNGCSFMVETPTTSWCDVG